MSSAYESTGEGVAIDPEIEVVVLVNGGSASASEIVAAALQERERATLIGEPTFGKNTVQVWGRLANEGGVRITISRWFTPEHNSVAPDGIQPDIAAARSAETPPEEDPALDAALAYLADQPVADGEATPRAVRIAVRGGEIARGRRDCRRPDPSASIAGNGRRWCAMSSSKHATTEAVR